MTEDKQGDVKQTEGFELDDDQLDMSGIIKKASVEHLQIKRALEHLKASLRIKIEHSKLSDEQVLKIAEQLDETAIKIIRV